MLAPLDALSVAAAVVQFVDFGLRIVSHVQEISESATGEIKQNETMHLNVSAFQDLSTTLMASGSHQIQTHSPRLFSLMKVRGQYVYVPILCDRSLSNQGFIKQ